MENQSSLVPNGSAGPLRLKFLEIYENSTQEVAKAICFLASQEASFMTGANINTKMNTNTNTQFTTGENMTVDGGVMAIGNWASVA